jgi:HPt (histidine-containing phosphotransfer) domain-containing protein
MGRWLPLPEGPSHTAHAPAASINGSPIDRSVLAELSVGGTAMELEIILRFHVFNVADVETLTRAVEQLNLDLLIHAAHRIKGASRTVGALALGEASERLELAGRAGDWHAVGSHMKAFEHEVGRLDDYVKSLAA